MRTEFDIKAREHTSKVQSLENQSKDKTVTQESSRIRELEEKLLETELSLDTEREKLKEINEKLVQAELSFKNEQEKSKELQEKLKKIEEQQLNQPKETEKRNNNK